MGEETGTELIAEERQRQQTEEGYDSDHDREHREEALVCAAVYYALPSRLRPWAAGLYPDSWEFKPGPTRIRELTKAGALIAAEIDRLLGQDIAAPGAPKP